MLSCALQIGSLVPRVSRVPSTACRATPSNSATRRAFSPSSEALASYTPSLLFGRYASKALESPIWSRIRRESYYSSSKLESGKRKKMKVRRNRRLAGMSNDIESHLTRDQELRARMLQQENTVMSPDENLPTLLKDQISREMKDPKMQQEFTSGPEGRARVLDHFRTVGSQIDRLYKLKELEKRVLEKEKRIMRGEETPEAIDDENDDFGYDPTNDPSSEVTRLDRSSLRPDDFVETEYQKYVSKRDHYYQPDERFVSAPIDSQAMEAMSRLPNIDNLPPPLRKTVSQFLGKDDRSSKNSHAADGSLSGASSGPGNSTGTQANGPRIVVDPQPKRYGGTMAKNDATTLEEGDAELPPWPTDAEIAASEAEYEVADVEQIKDDLSPFSQIIRAQRLEREHQQAEYLDTISETSATPLPLIYREVLKTQVLLKTPINEDWVRPFVPSGMTVQEFLVQEGIMPEESLIEKDLDADEAEEPVPVDVEGEIKVEGSCCTSLRQAVEKRHLGCLTVLCDPANGVIETGETPLHIAAILENIECARELLDKKLVDVNALSAARSSALHMACMRGDMNMIKFLIQRGARVNQGDDDGLTALHFAVASGASTSVVNYLIDQKANLLLGDNQGATALHVAADAGNVSQVRLLLSKGSPINEVTGDRETPLFLACEQGHLGAVEMLLANGADANVNNKVGFYPLHAATKAGSLEVVEALLAAKANTYVMDAGENTPLHIAALGAHYEICRRLIACGCPINAVTTEGWTALHIAAQVGSVQICNLLLDVGSSIHARNDEGSTVLHIALSAQQIDLLPVLLERGADVNVGDANNVTPLLLAIQEGRGDVALMLLEKGARPNTLTTDHVSPLHLAIEEGLWGIAQTLIERGVSPTQETLEGFQPIHIAAARDNVEWVLKLIQLGANPNALTHAGLTPLRIAQENGLKQMEAALKKNGARELDIFAWMELEAEAKKKREAEAEQQKKNTQQASSQQL